MNFRSTFTDYLAIFKVATRGRFDRLTPFCLLALGTVGVFFIYSAQLATGQTLWLRQVFWLGVGAALYVGVALLDYKVWLRWSHLVYLACLALLALVLVPGLGTARMGARRWLDIGPFSFQPAETAKLGVLIIAASILARSKIGALPDSIAVLAKLALAVGIPMLLILFQPDLGSALVIPPMVFSLLYVSQLSRRLCAIALGAFALVLGAVALDTWRYAGFIEEHHLSLSADRGAYESHGLLPLKDYQRNRILTWVAPDKFDPLGASWNLRQSLISVGSGGFAGKGWTKGTQAQLGYLPRGIAHNDFIASVIAEEKGFLGSITVLSLFGVVLMNGIRIAGLARDRFGTLLALGVTVLFAVHVFVNIAMTIGLVPITGIPLPFISYGGTFVLSCSLLQGLVQSVYRFRKEF